MRKETWHKKCTRKIENENQQIESSQNERNIDRGNAISVQKYEKRTTMATRVVAFIGASHEMKWNKTSENRKIFLNRRKEEK